LQRSDCGGSRPRHRSSLNFFGFQTCSHRLLLVCFTHSLSVFLNLNAIEAKFNLFNMFGPAASVRVPTDAIIPVHFFDDTPLWRSFILYSMFVFDDVLDPQKLRHSLELLAQREGWRKLGARLRCNVKAVLKQRNPHFCSTLFWY